MISGIQANTSLSAMTSTADVEHTSRHARMEKTMQPVADLLGMSASDLQQALQSGSTLADLAAKKGVSRSDLIAAITKGLEANKPEGAAAVEGTFNISQIANDIADGKGPRGPRGAEGAPPVGPPPGAARGFEELANKLGLSTDELRSKLQGGAHIKDIAAAQGVSSNDLLDTILTGIEHDSRL